MSKVTLDGIALQVNTNGVKPGQITVVDESQPWLARDAIANQRFNDDAQTFEVVSLSGKRHRISYVTGAPTVPINNNANLNSIYTKYLQTTYDVSGEGLARAQAQAFYNKYAATQLLWAQKAKLTAQISDPDIAMTTKQSLIQTLQSVKTQLFNTTMTLGLYGTSVYVIFAEGSSCQFTDWVISDHTDFQFTLISRTLV
jgi:hypothetical protein